VGLIAHNQILGSLNFVLRKSNFFGEKNLSVLQEIAAQLAIAIQHIRLIKQIRLNNEELERKVLERTAQLQISNRELEAFSWSVAHDLRSPLLSITGFSTILLEEFCSNLDPEGLRLLVSIRKNAERMEMLIKELLDLARLNKSSLNYRSIHMREMVLSEFEEDFSDEDRKSFDLQISELPDVLADPVLIRLVWQNLISNAIKFSRTSKVKKIVIEGKVGLKKVVFSIQDFVVGFDPRQKDKIWGAFQRLHPNDDFPGTGIGLAIVKKIVERHNGEVWVESEIGKGATFFFWLPKK